MELVELLRALDAALGEHRPAILSLQQWSLPAYRTYFMKGNAVKGREPGRDLGVLQTMMSRLGYGSIGNGRPDEYSKLPESAKPHRLYGWEWLKFDLVAATSPGPWGESVWMGKYRLDLALELENQASEFTLHMRGLLDTNATLRIGVFYAHEDSLDDVLVGTGRRMVRLAEWVPPWTITDWGGAPPTPQAPLVAVFLRAQEPRILGVRRWPSSRPDDGDFEDVRWTEPGAGTP